MNALDYFLSEYEYVVCIILALLELGHSSVQTLGVALSGHLGGTVHFLPGLHIPEMHTQTIVLPY